MASPITWAQVLALPGAVNDGLANVPTIAQTMLLNVVNGVNVTNGTPEVVDPNQFDGEDGPCTLLARCAMAAHMAILGKFGAGGALAAEADGRLSRQYAFPIPGMLGLTSYGNLFRSLVGSQSYGPEVL